METLKSGHAEEKLREIIAEQGGVSNIEPNDIPIGEERVEITSESSGHVLWINNNALVQLARLAGTPKHKGAGVVIHKKLWGCRDKRREALHPLRRKGNKTL